MFVKYLISLFFLLLCLTTAHANQKEEALSDSIKTYMRGYVSHTGPSTLFFDSTAEQERWLNDMSSSLNKILPQNSVLRDKKTQRDFLSAVHYEATRAGISSQIMLSIIHVESAFRQYAISSVSARGYMQVMPFWVKTIGDTNAHNLFALRTNLRYGSVIFRHYLDIENGNVVRALARYNGSLGKLKYPKLVLKKYNDYWQWE